MRTVTSLALLTALSAQVTGCGVDDRLSTSSDSNDSADATAGMQFDHVVHPPKEYYDAAFLDAVHDDGQFNLATGTPDVLFVNFDGAQLTKGFGAGQSFILCNQQATVPASGLSTADRQEILGAVQKFYSDVKANLQVTATKPAQGAFTTIHVGGSFRDLGCLGNGILGVAPFDVRDSNKNDIGFAFVPNNISNGVIAETIAHEAGHSYGLDHVVSRQDLMFASSSPGITGFLVSRTGGGAIQDSPAMLQLALGLAGTNPAPSPAPVPTVTIPAAVPTPTAVAGGPSKIPTANAPGGFPGLPNIPGGLGGLPGLGQLGAIGAILPTLLGAVAGGGAGGFDISKILAGFAGGAGGAAGFDISKILGQFIGGAGGAAGAAGAAGGFDPTKLIGQLGGLLGAGGAGGLPAGLAGILGGAAGGAGGFPAILSGILGGGGKLPAGLPDLSAIFGLGQGVPDLSALIKGLNGTKRVVAQNYTGAERAAMMNIVNLAYAQRYEELTQP